MMTLVAGIVVVLFALLLVGVTGMIFTRPRLAERFFRGFASSARTHYGEQAVRLVVGVALVVLAPTMGSPPVFLVLGWALVLTAIGLMLIPWRWHHRFAEKVIPPVVRHMRLYGVLLVGFAMFLLWGVLAG